MIKSYHLHELLPYVNWVFFFYAWNIKPKYAVVKEVLESHDCPACRENWIKSFKTEKSQNEAREAMRLYLDAQKKIRQLETQGHQSHAVFELLPAYAEGDNIIVRKSNGEMATLPFLRQQHTDASRPNMCLADFIAPQGYDDPQHVADRLGFFATSVDAPTDTDDPYERMLVQTILDRMAEATAERLHEEIRKELWGFAPDENLSIADMLNEKYQSIRPAVGYPSIPDQSFNFVLYDTFDMAGAGIQLTETGMMIPHAAVSGLIFAHPKAKYFAIGNFSDEQLADYAQRRKMSVDALRKFVYRS